MPSYTLDLPETTTLEVKVNGQLVFTEEAIVLDVILGDAQKGHDLLKQRPVWEAKFREALNLRYKCQLSEGQVLVIIQATLRITHSLKKSLNDLQTSLSATESLRPNFPQRSNGVCSPTSPASKHKEKLKAAKRRVD